MKILQFFTLLIIGLLMVILVNSMPMWANGERNSLLREELKENYQLWRSQQLKNYQYIYQKRCFCPLPTNEPLKVSVKNDKITQVVNLNNNQVITDLTLANTIEELFNIIEEGIQRNADELLITYDPTLGYPTRVAIDYQKILADDEITYTVKNLSKLN
ncbi:DUF6174 domain-containing protein [Cyanothece sp. BG0011]|uniref:DUF6174 domain-containing protein n=1 Tax=Cyanothece sp. BG0011 TaxID=2082950 RepID=UPI000D1F101E|nr:DUF6174 domain-containing protein [Cyanothece sp. BG0011]